MVRAFVSWIDRCAGLKSFKQKLEHLRQPSFGVAELVPGGSEFNVTNREVRSFDLQIASGGLTS